MEWTIAEITSLTTKARSAIQAAPRPMLLAGSIGTVLLIVFFIFLVQSKAGEVAGALGSLIGGIVGAGGAVWAVFLMLARQRQEETDNVADAVRTEVTTLAKYVIASIENCQAIKDGLKVPRQDAHNIVKSLASDPIIYPAVADRVGLLPHPHATAEFYMRLAEARTLTEMLRTKTDPQGIANMSPPRENITPEFASSVADCLITALQLARIIIANEGDASGKSLLATAVQATIISQIDDCFEAAKKSFPDAESFSLPDTPQAQKGH
jgi:hypothetical protein